MASQTTATKTGYGGPLLGSELADMANITDFLVASMPTGDNCGGTTSNLPIKCSWLIKLAQSVVQLSPDFVLSFRLAADPVFQSHDVGYIFSLLPAGPSHQLITPQT